MLTGFIPGPWLDQINFATLEPVKSSFISDTETKNERHSDLIWRVRCQSDWMYVYLLFEFQSSVNKYMAIRMMVYVGLLYQDLINTKQIRPDDKLPFVLPIVLYNGTPRWHAAHAVQELIAAAPEGFAQYQPQLRYFLIDEGSYSTETLQNLENLAAAIFLIETQTTLEGLHHALQKVLEWRDSNKHQALSSAIAKLASRVLRKKVPGAGNIPESIHDLKGVVTMLAENIENMILASEKKAAQRGEQLGEQKGMKQGGAVVLTTALTRRFGSLPSWAVAKIENATTPQLIDYTSRLFDAATLEDLFK